jgi:hypothetical protein
MTRLAQQRGGGLSNALDPDAGLLGTGTGAPAALGPMRMR